MIDDTKKGYAFVLLPLRGKRDDGVGNGFSRIR